MPAELDQENQSQGRPFPSSVPNSTSLSGRQALDLLFELSGILQTGLDRETLSICIQLIERGVNPEALAEIVRINLAAAQSNQEISPSS